jgi:hypothetical protein
MPLCFWATQTAVAALDLFVGAGRSKFTPYLPPHSAATVIQHAYWSYVNIKYPMRAFLGCINASIAHSNACSKAYQAEFDAWVARLNADLAKSNARMARLVANLSEHVGQLRRPVS